MSAEQKMSEIIASKQACEAEALMPLYDKLSPASADFMIGTWHGDKFDGGAEPNPINWYDKRFVSRTHVEPMLCQKEDGTVYAWQDWGEAQLREVEFAGKVQACLIYDKLPMMDYFRKVNDDLVVGLADIKGRPTDFFFWLEREK
jgi:hypothetical protein